jgi:hypothetical protein
MLALDALKKSFGAKGGGWTLTPKVDLQAPAEPAAKKSTKINVTTSVCVFQEKRFGFADTAQGEPSLTFASFLSTLTRRSKLN